MKDAFRSLALAALLALLIVPAFGQDITKGSIAGVVRDATGAVIPNVEVRLKSPYGDRMTTTGSAGDYQFPNLVVGPGYEVSVDKAGFAPAKVSDITVRV